MIELFVFIVICTCTAMGYSKLILLLFSPYIDEFQICVLELFRTEIQRGVLKIYFVKEKESLRIALMSIEKNLR